MKIKFGILTTEQIEKIKNTNSKLLYRLQAELTDYAKVLGCKSIKRLDSDKEFGPYWIFPTGISTRSITGYKQTYGAKLYDNNIGTRPTVAFSSIEKLCKIVTTSPIEKCIFGELPQTFASPSIQNELEELYINGELKETGRIFTRDISLLFSSRDICLYPIKEYEYNGKKYVRVNDFSNTIGFNRTNMEDGFEYTPSYWIEVEPITWLVDRENDLAISEKVIISGIMFDNRDLEIPTYKEYPSILELYLNHYFKNEIGIKELIDKQEIEYYKYVAFTSRLFQKLLNEGKKYLDVYNAKDEIVLTLVELINPSNIKGGVTKEQVMHHILTRTIKHNKNSCIKFDDFIKQISSCQLLRSKVKQDLINRINALKPTDGYEDHEYYIDYPPYRLILQNKSI